MITATQLPNKYSSYSLSRLTNLFSCTELSADVHQLLIQGKVPRKEYTFWLSLSGAVMNITKLHMINKHTNICVSWVSCTVLAFPLRLQWWLMITYCEKFCIQNKQTLQFTLLNFSPSLCGINDFKLWKPAFMLCILRRSLLLAISRLIFFSCSMWVLPGMDCDLQ